MYDYAPPAIAQGVVVQVSAFHDRYPESAAVILTPQCDIEHGVPADRLTIAACASAVAVLKTLDPKPVRDERNRLDAIMKGTSNRWHWLDPARQIDQFRDGALVDFQSVIAVEATALASATRLLGLLSPWRENLASRYASYAGRIGIPNNLLDVDRENLRNRIIQQVTDARRIDR